MVVLEGKTHISIELKKSKSIITNLLALADDALQAEALVEQHNTPFHYRNFIKLYLQ